jgi:hypothetical protein
LVPNCAGAVFGIVVHGQPWSPPNIAGIAREVSLSGPDVIEGKGVTHLRYRVAAAADASDDAAEATARQVAHAGRA